jgi:hypothetical protein
MNFLIKNINLKIIINIFIKKKHPDFKAGTNMSILRQWQWVQSTDHNHHDTPPT